MTVNYLPSRRLGGLVSEHQTMADPLGPRFHGIQGPRSVYDGSAGSEPLSVRMG